MSATKLQRFAPSLAALLVFACGGDPKPEPEAPAKASQEPQAKTAPAPAEADGARVKVVEGPAPGADDRFELHVEPVAAQAGQPASVTVRVLPKAPWHMNLDYPTSLRVEPTAGIELAQTDLKKSDATQLDADGCQFDVGFTPKASGEQTFTGQFKFAVCQDEACAPVTRDVEFKVAVK